MKQQTHEKDITKEQQREVPTIIRNARKETRTERGNKNPTKKNTETQNGVKKERTNGSNK